MDQGPFFSLLFTMALFEINIEYCEHCSKFYAGILASKIPVIFVVQLQNTIPKNVYGKPFWNH